MPSLESNADMIIRIETGTSFGVLGMYIPLVLSQYRAYLLCYSWDKRIRPEPLACSDLRFLMTFDVGRYGRLGRHIRRHAFDS